MFFQNFLKVVSKHLVVMLAFVLVSLAYFYPVLKGDVIYQSDIVQYTGMAKSQITHRIATDSQDELYWTDATFAGMPTYQLGAYYPLNYLKKLDWLLRFLPRPADYLFLYFLCFYVLLSVLQVPKKWAFIGSLVFGFSTYLIIIIGVGHNAKAHAVAYIPLVVSGFLLLYKHQKWIYGGFLFCVAMGLELVANHFQMTYYLMFLLAIIGGVYLYEAYKNKTWNAFLKSSLVAILGLVLAIGLNATSILATKEYADFSTRSASEITPNSSSSGPLAAFKKEKQTGLDKDYILSYSYGYLELFNLIVPRFMGGSSAEDLGNEAHIIQDLKAKGYSSLQARQFASRAPTYWGEQPYVGAPAYIGVGIFALFIFGLFYDKTSMKHWVLGAVLLSVLLSLGKNLEWLSDLFISYVPFYNKFRAVTSIQVLLEFCVPFYGIYVLYQFLNDQKITLYEQKNDLFKAFVAVFGALLVLFVFKDFLFTFSSSTDAHWTDNFGFSFVDALRQDRAAIFTSDMLRSLAIVFLVFGCIYLYINSKISKNSLAVLLGSVLVLDLVLVDWRYVNQTDFTAKKNMEQPFKATLADTQILKDTTHFRVYDLSENPFNSARASYFHNSLGGYHGAKPRRIQELFEAYLSKGYAPVFDMLNVKYFIFNEDKGVTYQKNERALGNAWFIDTLSLTNDRTEEFQSLGKIQFKSHAVTTSRQLFESGSNQKVYEPKSSDSIALVYNHPHKKEYEYSATNDGFVVFSEQYYKKGWHAYLDGDKVSYANVNYLLRGMETPKGKHKITFKFQPKVIELGTQITAWSMGLLLVLLFMTIYFKYTKKTLF